MTDDSRSFVATLLGDGRSLLIVTALVLIGSGGFALFQSATGQFLPHDTQYLGMTAQELCKVAGCRVVHFMFHDRVSFGGALIAIGILYLWLTEFALRRGEEWAWWALLFSGTLGFLSFLVYLGYGYLDTWHGVATLFLMPCFAWGLIRTRKLVPHERGWRSLLAPGASMTPGRLCLVLTGAGILGGGLTIMTVGMTRVFVPQDFEYMRMTAEQIRGLNPHLVPLIAHDRAGFGGGLASVGLAMLLIVWCGRPSRHLWEAVLLAGSVGFVTAIGIHPVIGYNSVSHLAPAVAGSLMFVAGVLFYPSQTDGSASQDF